jgi:hypothetical protein
MNPNLSGTERANLLTFAGFISSLSLFNLLAIAIHGVIHPSSPLLEKIVVHPTPASLFPLGHGLAAPLFLVVLFTTRRFVPMLVYSLLSLLPFVVQFARYYHTIYENSDVLFSQPGLNLLYVLANPIDCIVAGLLVFLALWQLSIIVRPYVRIESDSS